MNEATWWWVWPGNEATWWWVWPGNETTWWWAWPVNEATWWWVWPGKEATWWNDLGYLPRLHIAMASVWSLLVHCRDQSAVGGGCLKMRSFAKVAYCNGFSMVTFISINLC